MRPGKASPCRGDGMGDRDLGHLAEDVFEQDRHSASARGRVQNTRAEFSGLPGVSTL